ncbi:hypothetical protein TRFO_02702 [Tritrichomonas foetus]|uniref:Uncharacterized protein n=1 Tax=Tritrichomonas foetus TaxID=1144522 RepID=A0A1J4KZ59_9EUKA|nr:hypothetical protein TRFO_02702 [Tritrichomonas foetus]|eukprot:OHT16442.1 hypothetical protein TRFO_02702 [Tritrichomonas foetus]
MNESDWGSLLHSLIQDDLKSLQSLVPSIFSFNTIIPQDADPKITCLYEKHSILTFSLKLESNECAKYLIEGGADLNYKIEHSNYTAFHFAVLHNNLEIVKRLISCESLDRYVKTHDGFYALHIAASLGFDQLVEFFLQNHFYDPDLMTDSEEAISETALIISLKTRQDSVVSVLLDNGASPDKPSSVPIYPLHAAVDGNDVRSLQKLLSFPIDVNCRNNEGLTPLLLASRQGKKYIFDVLLEKNNIDVNAITNDGENVLFFKTSKPVYTDKHVFYSLLCIKNFNFNFQNPDGNTFLHCLIMNEEMEEIDVLLAAVNNLNLNIENNDKKTPLDIAIQRQSLDIIYLLLNYDTIVITEKIRKSNIPHLAASRNYGKIFDVLVRKGINIDEGDGTGITPLMIAAMKGHANLVRTLISTRKVDVNKTNSIKQNAFLIASMSHNSSMVRLLLCHPLIDPNVENDLGETALTNAVMYQNAETVEALLENTKVDPNYSSPKRDYCPFLEAIRSKNSRIVHAFLFHPKTDFTVVDSDNNNALHYALDTSDLSIVNIFVDETTVRQKSYTKGFPLEYAMKINFIQAGKLILDTTEEVLGKMKEVVFFEFS